MEQIHPEIKGTMINAGKRLLKNMRAIPRTGSRQITGSMKPTNKYTDKKVNYNAAQVSTTTFSQKKPENLGSLRRFLDWIAKGADKSNIGGTSCPG